MRDGSQYKPTKTIKIAASFAVIGVVTFGVAVSPLSPLVRAQNFQEQINALREQNATKQGDKNQLGAEASSLQEAVAKLQAQINSLQTQIKVNDDKRLETVAKIAAAEAELAKQKAVLADDIKAMYVGGQMTSLEQLATSKDLSDYADQEQYKVSVQHKIQNTLKSIAELKLKLGEEKATLDRMIADLNKMRVDVAAQKAEQSRLLSLNQAQQTELDSQIKANQSQISELRRLQIIANARFSGGAPGTGPTCGGGYPAKWCEIPLDAVVDSWGMFNRECVSYAAFKVAESGRYMPYWGGIGNANQWDENARRAGIPVNNRPAVGAVAQSNGGTWGHVMYVEHVYGDGTILISQYNAGLDGRYSEIRISTTGLNFIHFP